MAPRFLFLSGNRLSHVRWRSMDCQFPTEVFHNFELECVIFCNGLKHLAKARVTLRWKGEECELYKWQNDYSIDDSRRIGLFPRFTYFRRNKETNNFSTKRDIFISMVNYFASHRYFQVRYIQYSIEHFRFYSNKLHLNYNWIRRNNLKNRSN